MPEIPRYNRQVLPGRVPRAARLPLALPSFGGRALAEGLASMGTLVEQLDEAEAVSFTSKVSAEAIQHFTSRVPEAQREAPEGASGFAGVFDAEVKDYITKALKAAPSDQARELTEARLKELNLKILKENVTFEGNAGRAQRLSDIDQSRKALARSAFDAPDRSGEFLAQARGDLAAAADTWMLPLDISDRQGLAEKEIAQAAIKGLIAREPSTAVAALEAGHFDIGLDATTKASLVSQAKEASAAMERDRRAAEKAARRAEERALEDAQRATQDLFIARLADPNHPDGPLTYMDVLNSNLDPVGVGSKDAFRVKIKKQLSGEDLNVTDPRLYRDRAGRIATGEISDTRALIGDIGNGLSNNDYERLARKIENASTAKGRDEQQRIEEVLGDAKKELSGSNIFRGINDIVGNRLVRLFDLDLEDALEKGVAEGRSVREMLDVRRPDNVVHPLIQKYSRTQVERLRDDAQEVAGKTAGRGVGEWFLQWLGLDDEDGGGGAPAPALEAPDDPVGAETAIPPRKPGESTSEWYKRTGRKRPGR